MEKKEKAPFRDEAILSADQADYAAKLPKTAHGGGTFAGLSLYEKKSFLVNRAVDEMGEFSVSGQGANSLQFSAGMGRYQWCIWTLCGFDQFSYASPRHLLIVP
jgi:hypothetical protein